ncbi:hypothetical protein C8F01DRAFT_543331 [Mycena amicta]|nr:hypothetical protein C8F01DRAFT_543331 [Mycena amicta]
MLELRRLTLRLSTTIPVNLLSSLSAIPSLTQLEIHNARLDGPLHLDNVQFPVLDTLLLRVASFHGGTRAADVHKGAEYRNIATLLACFAPQLAVLCISGDLVSSEFMAIRWPRLREFTIRDEFPRPFIPVPTLIDHMPVLGTFRALYAATAPYAPPINLGCPGGSNLSGSCPHLTSVSISNWHADDPIFAQLPESLESLHLLRVRAWSKPDRSTTPRHFLTTANRISHASHLTTLTVTLGTRLSDEDIRVVAEKFPRLRWLHLGQYVVDEQYYIPLVDLHLDSYMVALRQFQHLEHLKISINIPLEAHNRGIPAHAAFRIL